MTDTTDLQVGDIAPEFTTLDSNGTSISLSDIISKGSEVILYFYPKDNTPGCTTEGENFRDFYPQFKKLNTEIYGVSRESIKSHENFIDKYNFPFELISDPDESLCNLFDVIKEKSMYGKKYMGIERSTFLID